MNDLGAMLADLDTKLVKEKDDAARYRAYLRVQRDFYNEAIEYIADRTEHPHLATTIMFDLVFGFNLTVNYHTEPDMIEGVFESKSSIHPGSGGWISSTQTQGMSKDEFWSLKRTPGFQFNICGGIEAEELTEDFWNKGFWVTNGWPVGSADTLHVFQKKDPVTGQMATEEYVEKYDKSGRYKRYIIEELRR